MSSARPQSSILSPQSFDVVVVGAGPNGIACAVHAQRAGLRVLVLERGRVVESFERYPRLMRFSSTREKMVIPGFPFEAPPHVQPDPWPGAWPADLNPTRDEAIAYYRNVVAEAGLDVRTRRRVVAIERCGRPLRAGEGRGGGGTIYTRFAVAAATAGGECEVYEAPFVVVATGSFDHPALLGLPGEDLPHVSHYFTQGADHAGKDVVIVGGTSSALEAALLCRWAGARVTLVHRRAGIYASPTFKSPPRDALAASVRRGEIQAVMGARVVEITPDAVFVEPVPAAERTVVVPPMNTSQSVPDPTGPIGTPAPPETVIDLGPPIETPRRLPAGAVLLLTGYRADRSLLRAAGVAFNPANGEPLWDRETCETNTPGLYVVGAAGNPEGTGNRVGITSGLPQAARAMAALVQRARLVQRVPAKEKGERDAGRDV